MLTQQLIAKIIQEVMSLEDGQIWIYNQQRQIPNTKGLSVVVGLVDFKPYGVNLHNLDGVEVRSVQAREIISIDLYSYDVSAPTRLPELLGALHSTYGEQIQEQYGFKLAAVPVSCLNTSEVEGSAIPYRFTVTTTVLRAYSNTDPIDYYDTFSLETFNEEGKV